MKHEQVLYRDPWYNEYIGNVTEKRHFHWCVEITEIRPSGKYGSIFLGNKKVGDRILVAIYVLEKHEIKRSDRTEVQ